MQSLLFILMFFMLLVITIRMLPFINIEAAMRMQFWIREVIQKMEDISYRVEKQKKDRR